MPRQCSVCFHPEREAIERAIVEGKTYREIAQGTALSKDALSRHRAHIAETLSSVKAARQTATAAALAEVVAADSAREVQAGASLLDRLFEISRASREIMTAARASGEPELALKAIARLEKHLELEGRLIGELQSESAVNVTVGANADSLLLSKLLAWLAPFPAARVHVAECVRNEFGDWEVQ